jgi:hypothetical protein
MELLHHGALEVTDEDHGCTLRSSDFFNPGNLSTTNGVVLEAWDEEDTSKLDLLSFLGSAHHNVPPAIHCQTARSLAPCHKACSAGVQVPAFHICLSSPSELTKTCVVISE